MRILAVFTCFNRKEKTETCIRTITAGNPSCSFTFVAADDGSTDGTPEMLEKLQSEFEIHIVRGDGSWFYSGGMHAAMVYALEKLTKDFDYLVMLNDDVTFFAHSIEQMIRQSREQENAVLAYGLGQFGQGLLVKVFSRLVQARLHLGDGQGDGPSLLGVQGGIAQQGVQPSS